MGDSTTEYAGAARQTMGWFVLVSAALHLLGVGVVASVPWFDGSDVADVEADEEREEMSVKLAQPREPEPAPEEAPTPEREEKEAEQAVPEPEEEREKPEPTERRNRKTVDQQNNEENPQEADYLASEANQTDEQTRARETTTSRAEPAEEQSPNERDETTPEGGENPAAMASRASPRERSGSEESRREPSEPSKAPEPPERSKESERTDDSVEEPESERAVDESGDMPTPDGDGEPSRTDSEGDEQTDDESAEEMPKGPPMPTMGEYERMFGGEDAEREERADRETGGQGGPGSDVFRNIEERQGRVKAALENYLTHIKPGNHTSVNAERSVYASYINRIHRKMHANWGNEYLPRLDDRYGPGHPLSNSDLRTTLEIVVDGGSGEVEDVNIVDSSGVTSYDAEAVMIAYDTGPHPEAPDEVVSPDGNVYLHWNFWRNQRQCGTFGVSVYKRTDTEGGGSEKREIAPSGDEE